MLSRREVIALGLAAAPYRAAVPGETRQATGFKIGEMTPESARVWLRRTAASRRLEGGIVRRGHQKNAKYLDPETRLDTLEGSAPGEAGYLRVRYEGGGKRGATPWLEANEAADFAVQTTLRGLRPGTEYRVMVETRAARARRVDGELGGAFRTLPLAQTPSPAKVALLSCQMYCHMDRGDGFHIYESIRRAAPDFLLSCGDNVYYDNEDPIADSEAVARYHWQRMYSLPTLVDCLRQVGGYWQKDDHDTLSDDAWPAMTPGKMKKLTFAAGQRIFREQVPNAAGPLYRRVRVGRDLEFWLLEARDYRSANTDPDGAAKSIWGAEQKQWLMQSLRESEATFKVLVNPNPLVGPDRLTKRDNHANQSFQTEGDEIRRFLQNHFADNVISVCGDRHWQYHSVHPVSGLHEFACGAASDEHAGGTPGYQAEYHRFHRVKGGYLEMGVKREGGTAVLTLTHRDVRGAAMHEHAIMRRV